MSITSLTTVQGATIAAVVTIPMIAQDVAARIADPIIRQIPNGSVKISADFALRFTVYSIATCATAYVLSMPYSTALTINAIFSSAIFVYTLLFRNSFTIDYDILVNNYNTLVDEHNEIKNDYNTLVDKHNEIENDYNLVIEKNNEMKTTLENFGRKYTENNRKLRLENQDLKRELSALKKPKPKLSLSI